MSTLDHNLTAAAPRWSGVLCRLGAYPVLVPALQVAAVLALPPDVTPVPGSAAWVRGVANLRGGLVTLLDLVALVQGGRPTPRATDRGLLLRQEAPPCALVVTAVIGIRQCAAMARTAPAPGGLAALAPFVQDAFDLAGEAVPVLALDRVLGAAR